MSIFSDYTNQELVVHGYFRDPSNYPTISFIPHEIIDIVMYYYVCTLHVYGIQSVTTNGWTDNFINNKDSTLQLLVPENWKIQNLILGNGGYFLIVNNKLFVRGDNTVGSLGINGHNIFDQWVKNENFCDKNVPKLISTSSMALHTYIWTKSNKLFSCGANRDSSLGLNHSKAVRGINKIKNVKFKCKLKSIISGVYHTLFLLQNGDIYGVGSNYDGQLGQRKS